jgi:hypothetical protein
MYLEKQYRDAERFIALLRTEYSGVCIKPFCITPSTLVPVLVPGNLFCFDANMFRNLDVPHLFGNRKLEIRYTGNPLLVQFSTSEAFTTKTNGFPGIQCRSLRFLL